MFLVFVIFDGPFDLEQNPGTFLGRSSNSIMVWSPGHSKGFGQVLNGKMFATMGMPFTNGNNHMCMSAFKVCMSPHNPKCNESEMTNL